MTDRFAIPPDCEGWWDSDTDLVIVHPMPSQPGRRHGAHVTFPPHELVSRDPLTISPSLACGDGCGWHVHVRDGEVVS